MNALQDFSVGDTDYTSKLNANSAAIVAAITALETGKVDVSKLGAAGGVPTLGADGKVPSGQLPDTSTYQLLSQRGQPGGYASLDSGGKVPSSQLPTVALDTSIFQAKTEKGAANGYAGLDASGLVPVSQLPATGQPAYVDRGVGVPLLVPAANGILFSKTFDVATFVDLHTIWQNFPPTIQAGSSYAKCATYPTANTTFILKKNGHQAATLLFTPGTQWFGTFIINMYDVNGQPLTLSAAISYWGSMQPGDVLEIDGPATPDATLAGITLIWNCTGVVASVDPSVIATTYQTQTAAATQTAKLSPTQLNCFFPGKPAGGQTLARFKLTYPITFANQWGGSYADLGVNPTSPNTYSVRIKRNGVEVGYVSFTYNGFTTFYASGPIGPFTYNAGDTIELVAQATADPVVSDITVTLAGTK